MCLGELAKTHLSSFKPFGALYDTVRKARNDNIIWCLRSLACSHWWAFAVLWLRRLRDGSRIGEGMPRL